MCPHGSWILEPAGRRGIPLHILERMLGHKSLATTQKYLAAVDLSGGVADETPGLYRVRAVFARAERLGTPAFNFD